jgi:flagellar hook-basal body complex protein FliE
MQTAMSAMTAVNSPVSNAGLSENFPKPNGISSTASTPFSSLLTDAVGQVSSLENQARATVDGLMTGSGVDVHQAMIATQKADMTFELALAVRNKAVAAYQQVMGMQF